ncbi:MAG: type II secretion system major pseudopilin GspG [Thioalkalivibrionaceae bacterium]
MRRNRGFTLIELLVVLVILGLLAGLVGPRVLDRVGGAKTDTAAVQIEDLERALELFVLDVGRYPTTEEGLEALVRAPAGVNRWNGPYLRRAQVPQDPWGRPFQYRFPGQHGVVDIWSLGADGQPGGSGENAEIGNW